MINTRLYALRRSQGEKTQWYFKQWGWGSCFGPNALREPRELPLLKIIEADSKIDPSWDYEIVPFELKVVQSE